MKVDPVCGMEVDERSEHRAIYKGRIYFFCSRECKEEFERDPEAYLKGGPKGMPHK